MTADLPLFTDTDKFDGGSGAANRHKQKIHLQFTFEYIIKFRWEISIYGTINIFRHILLSYLWKPVGWCLFIRSFCSLHLTTNQRNSSLINSMCYSAFAEVDVDFDMNFFVFDKYCRNEFLTIHWIQFFYRFTWSGHLHPFDWKQQRVNKILLTDIEKYTRLTFTVV